MIWLIGPGGAGKTTAGPLVADRLGLPFHDLDRRLAEHLGNIDDFIAAHGYEGYARANVEESLSLLEDTTAAVVALSSGFMTRASREEAVVRERFPVYASLSAHKIETMRPPTAVAAAILERAGS